MSETQSKPKRSAYVAIAACGHVRAAAAFDADDFESVLEATRTAKPWKRRGHKIERWDDMDRVRATFGSCDECDPLRSRKAKQ